MQEVFSEQSAESLRGDRLIAAKRFLVQSLATATGIPFEIVGDDPTIHRTEIRSTSPCRAWHTAAWRGFVGSTSYLGEGRLAFGAFMFPLIGDLRIAVMRRQGERSVYDYTFRYLLLKEGAVWEDLGWQTDEYGEFDHWYVDDR